MRVLIPRPLPFEGRHRLRHAPADRALKGYQGTHMRRWRYIWPCPSIALPAGTCPLFRSLFAHLHTAGVTRRRHGWRELGRPSTPASGSASSGSRSPVRLPHGHAAKAQADERPRLSTRCTPLPALEGSRSRRRGCTLWAHAPYAKARLHGTKIRRSGWVPPQGAALAVVDVGVRRGGRRASTVAITGRVLCRLSGRTPGHDRRRTGR